MLMRVKKPDEEESIQIDAPEHETMWEVARKDDKGSWRLDTNVIACEAS